MNNNDIYSRLLAGESMEDIMEDLTAQANEAQARYDEFKRMEEERLRLEEAERKMREAAEREAKNAAKRDHLIDLLSETLYFCAEFYPSLGITTEEVDEMSDEALGALADLAIMALDMEIAQKTRKPFPAVMTLPFRTKDSKNKEEKVTEPVKPTTDDIFASFFKTFM